MRWTVSRVPVACGAEGACQIPPGEPVAALNGGKNYRCARHAAQLGHAVDWTEVESERWRLENDLRRAAAARLEPPATRSRVRLTAPVKAWTAVADLVPMHDPRLPLGDRD